MKKNKSLLKRRGYCYQDGGIAKLKSTQAIVSSEAMNGG